MKILLLLSIAVLSSARMQLKNEWEVWKREHGKAYADSREESLRHAVWFQNFHHIQEHNKKESFKLSLNEFADLVRLLFLCFPAFGSYSFCILDKRTVFSEVPTPSECRSPYSVC